jgi:hypothetical protein
VDGFLDLRLQLEIEQYARIRAAFFFDLLPLLLIGAIDLGVVFCFPRLDQSVIKLLIGRKGIALAGQLLPMASKRDDFDPFDRLRAPITSGVDDIDRCQTFLLKKSQVAAERSLISA